MKILIACEESQNPPNRGFFILSLTSLKISVILINLNFYKKHINSHHN